MQYMGSTSTPSSSLTSLTASCKSFTISPKLSPPSPSEGMSHAAAPRDGHREMGAYIEVTTCELQVPCRVCLDRVGARLLRTVFRVYIEQVQKRAL